MHAPGARFHFGAGAVRSCARGLPYRGTRDCPCVGRAVSIRDPTRIRRGAKPKQGRGATPSIWRQPPAARPRRRPTRPNDNTRRCTHKGTMPCRHRIPSGPYYVAHGAVVMSRLARLVAVACRLAPLGCGSGPMGRAMGRGAAVRPDKFGRISIVYGFEVGSPKFVT